MLCKGSLIALAIAVTTVLAAPAPVNINPLVRRSGQEYICRQSTDAALTNNDGALIGTISQDRSIGYLRDAKTKPGSSGYPLQFGNGENLAFSSGCTGKTIWELPVLDSGLPYDYKKKKSGNSPGRMRVYYADDLTWCGIGTKSNPDNSGRVHLCQAKNT